ncbi:hypothetical protein MPTK1_5g22260 [Marchantia polymorpha subsp. ruderalis]|uniref:Uncharacterized protein n=2 Tax=Marchantia polymorpha TaxID=3197 RepID=A0AAF6BL24_MARPO|nr:hypothetical protein MARPO_0166s0020 [Marchantia polymorpha]BBN12708.1 hypothetical protein Mp_5g22260 [Marchantia polymorpha subsp. ruderalis]|eukprot:PTQ28364.1 hypothetical protein MARPO_0166s0020 [Marchantia polymorpha]
MLSAPLLPPFGCLDVIEPALWRIDDVLGLHPRPSNGRGGSKTRSTRGSAILSSRGRMQRCHFTLFLDLRRRTLFVP